MVEKNSAHQLTFDHIQVAAKLQSDCRFLTLIIVSLRDHFRDTRVSYISGSNCPNYILFTSECTKGLKNK